MPAPDGQLRTNYSPKQQGVVTGRLLNKIGAKINDLQPSPTGGFENMVGGKSAQRPPTLVGVAKITAVLSGTTYECSFRYFNGAINDWDNFDSTMTLDSGVYSGSRPGFQTGDCVGATWDVTANACVPLMSIPDQPAYANIYSDEGRLNVPNTSAADSTSTVNSTLNSGGTHDAVHIVLEHFRSSDGNWVPLEPQLVLRPDSARGMTSGSIPIIVSCAQGDLLRVRYGTSKFSRSQMDLGGCGLAIRWLGRVHNGSAVGVETDARPQDSTQGYGTVKNFFPVALCRSTFNDQPTVALPLTNRGVRFETEEPDEAEDSAESGGGGDVGTENIRIDLSNASHRWLAEITLYANVTSQNLTKFAKLQSNDDAGTSPGDQTVNGDWLQPNSRGLFSAVLIRDYDGTEYTDSNRNLNIWLAFIDRWGQLTGNVLAEQGVVYGPVEYTGDEYEAVTEPPDDDPESGSTFDKRPIYAATIVNEEYFGKYSGNLNKGESADFRILGRNDKETQITLNAKVRYNRYAKEKVVVIRRVVGGDLVANPIECAGG